MFAVRKLFNMQIPLCKTYMSNSKLIEVTHENNTGITTISMTRQPVNGLNKELLNALKTSLMDAQKNHSTGVILTSALPTIFSGGLDLMEMYNRTESQLTEYWQTLQDTWLTLYGLEIPLAAAINGASPAGGCLLGLSSEYRVFVKGYRKAEMACLRGSLFNPEEALQVGLVDELAVDKTDAINKCQKFIQGFKHISSIGRSQTKIILREPNLLWMKENRDKDLKEFITYAQLPQVQAGIKLYIESLKRK